MIEPRGITKISMIRKGYKLTLKEIGAQLQ